MRRSSRHKLSSALAGCGVALATTQAAYAVTPVSYSGGMYFQDFNSLPDSGGPFGPFSGNGPFGLPNSLPEGWSFGRLAGTQDLQFVVGNGSSTALGLVASMGADGSTDRALGSASTTAAQARYGLTLVNNTALPINQFTISFANEQWRTGGGTNGSMNVFAYATGTNATDINNGTFTAVPAGLHVGSIAQGTNVGAVDGNSGTFRRDKTGSVTGFTWAPGETLILRWDDINAPGAEDWLAMDDFTFSARYIRNLTWNANSGNWNQDPANTIWIEELGNAPSAFANGDNVIFDDISADSTVTIDPGGVAPTGVLMTHAANTYTFTGGAIAGGTLSKTGAGNVVITTSNTFAGPSTLSGGSVETQVEGAFGTNAVTLTDITWKATSNPQNVTNAFTVNGMVTFETPQTVTLSGATISGGTNSALIFNNTSANPNIIPNMPAFGGNVHVRAGTIKASSTDGDLFTNTTIVTIDEGATVDFSANGDSIGGLEGGGTLVVGDIETAGESFVNFNAAGDRTFWGIVTGTGGNGFIQRGGGTFTLTGNSTFTTPTIIESGAIAVGANVLADVPGPLGSNATAIQLGGGAGAVGSPALLIAGPFEIARPINVVVNTNIANVTLGGNTDHTSKFSGAIDLQRAVRLISAATGTNVVEFSGTLGSGPAGFNVAKVGPGTVVLSGTNTYTGATNVEEGTLRITGSIANSSGVSIVGGATLDVARSQFIDSVEVMSSGRMILTSSGDQPTVLKTLGLEIDAAGFGVADVGTGAIVLDDGPDPQRLQDLRAMINVGYAGGTWTGTGITSSAAAANPTGGVGYAVAGDVLGPAGGDFLGTATEGDDYLIRYTIRGDANLNGRVAFEDLVALAQNYNNNTGTAVWSQGDFNYDGNVDFGDLVALAQNYNAALPVAPIAGAGATFGEDLAKAFAQVPEPGGLVLLAVGICGIARRRRRVC